MKEALAAARKAHIQVFYGLHQQWEPGMFDNWLHATGSNLRQAEVHFFAEGTSGAQVLEGLEPQPEEGDVVVSKHWNSK